MKLPYANSLTVIARRHLRDAQTGQPVEILVYLPVQDADTWVCRVEILRDGATSPVVDARGVDSFQALIIAIAATRNSLKDVARGLSWLGDAGELGLPLVVQDEGADFIGLVESLLETEYRRQIIFRKALHRNRAGK